MNNTNDVLFELRRVIDDCEQCGREIYYAMRFIPHNNPGRANLKLALQYLGITGPESVGLSRSVLEYRGKDEEEN